MTLTLKDTASLKLRYSEAETCLSVFSKFIYSFISDYAMLQILPLTLLFFLRVL